MEISQNEFLHLYYYLRLTRALEERVATLYRQGRIVGGVYTSHGMEAISVGYASALQTEDIIAPFHRDMGAFLVRGITPGEVLAQYLGKRTGPTKGKDGNVHMGDLKRGIFAFVSHLADNLPVATGAALAFKIRGESRIVATNTGDGGTSRGDFHEALNFASVLRLPVVFFCNNNQYAYSTPLHHQMAIKDVVERAKAYAIPGEIVDGNDVASVYLTAKRAFQRARAGEGPTFIECKTMRMHGHSEHDSAKYVPRELLEEWKKKDPILKAERMLKESGYADESDFHETKMKVDKEIEAGLEFAEHSPLPEGPEALEGVFAANHIEVLI
ncbi:MAG: thiamine pyrophosphate-dependent dehydrogenase E1 component subunit alpha [Nitrospirales bacterium]|nr:thiamine pyrophosphate-dependent dehydrogenase E1 component subunit alpha [Nitrospira sp.]MDR4460136.1 thiamine pyrophosphate-dependent dehydrogenase E1 component subunit alpha [Nitrospirales bacterium]